MHVYTSPHLVRFHERIRVAGSLIDEIRLATILEECQAKAAPGSISYFEAATAAAFTAFAREPADFAIIEVGLGGRLDATNIISKPLATIITRLSFDHRDFLGETMSQIATEKAGIMKKDVPCFAAPQPDPDSVRALRLAAGNTGSILHFGSVDWRTKNTAHGFHFIDQHRDIELPRPALLGAHQIENAGVAIAATAALPERLSMDAIQQGLRTVIWPARLQKLSSGVLAQLLPQGSELWLDGGHNDSAGEALAAQAKTWQDHDGLPLQLVFGMLTSKNPQEFLTPMDAYIAGITTVNISDEPLAFTAENLADVIRDFKGGRIQAASNLKKAINELAKSGTRSRILICGSLYLAGHALGENGTAPV